jgi:hypothetical protein
VFGVSKETLKAAPLLAPLAPPLVIPEREEERRILVFSFAEERLFFSSTHRKENSTTPLPSFYFFSLPSTWSLSALAATNAGADRAAMVSASPVLGLRPALSGRSRRSKVPKPATVTFSPLVSWN